MERGFEVDQGNAVCTGGRIFELRNFYNLAEVCWSTHVRTLNMTFCPHTDYGQHNAPVSLVFERVRFLKINFNAHTDMPIELDEIGYKNESDFDLNFLLTESQAEATDHLVFRLAGEHFVRVLAEQAKLVEHRSEAIG